MNLHFMKRSRAYRDGSNIATVTLAKETKLRHAATCAEVRNFNPSGKHESNKVSKLTKFHTSCNLCRTLVAMLVVAISIAFSQTVFAQGPKFEKDIYAGVSLNNYVGSDVDNADIKAGFNVGVTARYYVINNGFIEGSLEFLSQGYKSKDFSTSGQYWDDWGANYDSEIKSTFNTYNFQIPVYLGYRLRLPAGLNLKFKVGPYVSYAISGNLKKEGYIIYYPDIHSSEKEDINDKTSIDDLDGFKRFEWGLGGSISVQYGRLFLSGTFQRSLQKQFDVEAYAQNIKISLGVCF